jgi:hypothetical protein
VGIFPPCRLPGAAEAVRARDEMMDADCSASQAAAGCLSHVRASAIAVVCRRVIEALDRETLIEVCPETVRLTMRGTVMNEAAWLDELNSAGTELPPRSRIGTTIRGSPFGSGPNDDHAGRMAIGQEEGGAKRAAVC